MKGRTAPLKPETIVRTALVLLNEAGVDGLTTRKLAERLGVQQPALYWHFKNRRALLDALATEMLAENHTRPFPLPGENWRTFLAENARSFRRALLAYRDGALIHAGTRPDEDQFDAIEAQLSFLCETGFDPMSAAYALITIGHYTVGSVIEQQSDEAGAAERRDSLPAGTRRPPPIIESIMSEFEAAGPEKAFEYGLEAILNGLEAKVGRARKTPAVKAR